MAALTSPPQSARGEQQLARAERVEQSTGVLVSFTYEQSGEPYSDLAGHL